MKKCVTIYCNIAITNEVTSVMRGCGVEHYTLWPRITGTGPITGPRFDSHVWPGANACIQIIIDEAGAVRLMDALQTLRDSVTGRQAGLYAFMTSVDRVLV